jgi:hypothetical protein
MVKMIRFYVLMAADMQVAVFWDAALCNPIEIDQCFREFRCVHHQGDGAMNRDDGCSKHLKRPLF